MFKGLSRPTAVLAQQPTLNNLQLSNSCHQCCSKRAALRQWQRQSKHRSAELTNLKGTDKSADSENGWTFNYDWTQRPKWRSSVRPKRDSGRKKWSGYSRSFKKSRKLWQDRSDNNIKQQFWVLNTRRIITSYSLCTPYNKRSSTYKRLQHGQDLATLYSVQVLV